MATRAGYAAELRAPRAVEQAHAAPPFGGAEVGGAEGASLGERRVFRLAIARFRDWPALERVVAELEELGLGTESLRLVTARESRHRGFECEGSATAARDLSLGNDTLREWCERALPRVDAPGAACECEDGLIEDLCATLLGVPEAGGDTPPWIAGEQQRKLSEHLEQGDLLLVVSSETPAQQDASTRILLQCSRHGVSTYDFTL